MSCKSAVERSCCSIPALESFLEADTSWEFCRAEDLSANMRFALAKAERASRADCPILLYGEPGVGKRRLARIIHCHSMRHRSPMVVVEPSRQTAEEVWTAMFGPVEGASTESNGVGAVHQANHGTLVIHEVAALPEPVQGQLLRLLESGTTVSVGGSASRKTDVRVLGTTAESLQRRRGHCNFLPALYYHLSGVTVCVPPLRERREEIPLLVGRFLKQYCSANNMPMPVVDSGVMHQLIEHSWPGNLDELAACLEAMVCESGPNATILKKLPEGACAPATSASIAPPSRDVDSKLADIERQVVFDAMERHGNNRTKTAEALGISVRTLQRKLKRWNYSG